MSIFGWHKLKHTNTFRLLRQLFSQIQKHCESSRWSGFPWVIRVVLVIKFVNAYGLHRLNNQIMEKTWDVTPVTNWLTDRHGKVDQYSVWAESAIKGYRNMICVFRPPSELVWICFKGGLPLKPSSPFSPAPPSGGWQAYSQQARSCLLPLRVPLPSC